MNCISLVGENMTDGHSPCNISSYIDCVVPSLCKFSSVLFLKYYAG